MVTTSVSVIPNSTQTPDAYQQIIKYSKFAQTHCPRTFARNAVTGLLLYYLYDC